MRSEEEESASTNGSYGIRSLARSFHAFASFPLARLCVRSLGPNLRNSLPSFEGIEGEERNGTGNAPLSPMIGLRLRTVSPRPTID